MLPVKSKVKISQNFVAFSEYMNFNTNKCVWLFRWLQINTTTIHRFGNIMVSNYEYCISSNSSLKSKRKHHWPTAKYWKQKHDFTTICTSYGKFDFKKSSYQPFPKIWKLIDMNRYLDYTHCILLFGKQSNPGLGRLSRSFSGTSHEEPHRANSWQENYEGPQRPRKVSKTKETIIKLRPLSPLWHVFAFTGTLT